MPFAAERPFRGRCLALATLVATAAACSGGNSTDGGAKAGSGGPGAGASGRELIILATRPADLAVQLPLDAALEVDFDGALAPHALDIEGTGLFVAATGARWNTATELRDGGRTAVFAPTAPLPAETDLELRLSPLTHDHDGRLLDREVRLRFRTLDETPPSVAEWSFDAAPHPVRVDRPLVVRFDEELDPETVSSDTVGLRDLTGRTAAVDLEVDGPVVTVRPVVDIRGAYDFVLSIRGVADRSGNRAGDSWSARARTPDDREPPRLLSTWPATPAEVSPHAAPRLTFSESILLEDGGLGLTWKTSTGAPVAFDVISSRDARTVRLVPRSPLPVGAVSNVASTSGAGAPTDLSGNRLRGVVEVDLVTGDDARPPTLSASIPAPGAQQIPPYVAPLLTFDEPLESASVGAHTVELVQVGGPAVPLAAATLELDGTAVRVVPAAPLDPGARHRLSLRTGLDGIRDIAGNPIARDVVVEFDVNADTAPPQLVPWPADEAVAVATDASLVWGADRALDPSSVGPTTVVVTDSNGVAVPGRVVLARGDRAVRFEPDARWLPGTRYVSVVRGGATGLRAANGNWLPDDQRSAFRSGYRSDDLRPRPVISFEAVAAARSRDRCLPQNGFAIEVRPVEVFDPSFDPTAVDLSLTFAGGSIPPEELTAAAEFRADSFRIVVTAAHPLPEGRLTARVQVRDLSGNTSDPVELTFEIAAPDDRIVPFERTQVVWVRFDLDRDGNGRPDLEDDLLRLGLCAEGDPLGANARMEALMRDGVVARAHELFGRTRNGAPRDADSAAIRLTADEPRGIPHMQIACGGFDPEGAAGRAAGARSTGTLGRAWFDYRNESPNERNVSLSPGLGVFPAELFLFEVRVHSQVYPSFVTAFAERFLPLAPALGGTPAGRHPRDVRVLSIGFDPATAASADRARWETIFRAADDWATATGVILAHEIGHSIGLTAVGTGRDGLHGDASLHNADANTTDVMAAAIGFDAMVSLDFRFRDLNLAYLRHRVLLR